MSRTITTLIRDLVIEVKEVYGSDVSVSMDSRFRVVQQLAEGLEVESTASTARGVLIEICKAMSIDASFTSDTESDLWKKILNKIEENESLEASSPATTGTYIKRIIGSVQEGGYDPMGIFPTWKTQATEDALSLIESLSSEGYTNSYWEDQIITFARNIYEVLDGRPSAGDIFPFVGETEATQKYGLGGTVLTKNGTISHGLYGSKGDGLTGYWDTGVNPNTAFNNNGMMVWVMNGMATDASERLGCADVLGRFLMAGSAINLCNGGALDDGTINSTAATNNVVGIMQRNASLTRTGLYADGAVIQEKTGTSGIGNFPSQNSYMLAWNSSGTAGQFSDGTVSFHALLEAIHPDLIPDFNAAIREYQLTVGRLPITSSTSASDVAQNYINQYRIGRSAEMPSLTRTTVRNFTAYLSSQSLLDNFVCYPLTDSSNVRDSEVYPLGGLTQERMTLYNSPTFETEGLTFNGTSQFGRILGLDVNNFSELSAFVKWEQYASTSSNFNQIISQSTGLNGGFEIRLSAGKTNIQTLPFVAATTAVLTEDQFNTFYMSATYGGSGIVKVNNSPVENMGNYPAPSEANYLEIGQRNGSQFKLNMKMAHVAIMDAEVTETQADEINGYLDEL